MRKWLVWLLILLLPLTMGMDMGRRLTIEADGEIDYESVSGNKAAVSGLIVQGEGYFHLNASSKFNANSYLQDYKMILEAKQNTFMPIRAAVGVLVGEDEYYVSVLEPAIRTELEHTYFVDENNIVIENEVTMYGKYRHFINFENENTKLWERLEHFGLIHLKDALEFTRPEEVIEEATEEGG